MIAPSLPSTPSPAPPSASGDHGGQAGDSARSRAADRKDAAHGRKDAVDGKQDQREERSEFARMMERPEAQATAPAEEGTAVDTATTTTGDAEDTIDPSLPERLLGLLAGIVPAAAPPASGAGAATAAATDVLTAPPASLAAAVPTGSALPGMPGTPAQPALPGTPGDTGALPLPLATATPADAAATPLPHFSAMLEPADVGVDLTTTDAGEATPLTSLTGTNTAGALRPGTAATLAAAAPLALPADPDAGFDDAFGARIGWMAEQKVGHAQLRVSPDQMGTIDVRLHLDGNKVSAEFASASAEVRNALENSVGRLRDMLGQHGLQLTHSDVGQGRGGDGDAQRGGPGMGHGHEGLEEAELVPVAPPRWMPTRGLLDEYA